MLDSSLAASDFLPGLRLDMHARRHRHTHNHSLGLMCDHAAAIFDLYSGRLREGGTTNDGSMNGITCHIVIKQSIHRQAGVCVRAWKSRRMMSATLGWRTLTATTRRTPSIVMTALCTCKGSCDVNIECTEALSNSCPHCLQYISYSTCIAPGSCCQTQ